MALASLFGREERVIRDPKWNAWGKGDDVTGSGNTSAGVTVSQQSAMQLLVVYGCTTLIADALSTMPVRHLEIDGNVEVEPRAGWLDMPNGDSDWPTFVVQVALSILYGGEVFLAPVRRGGEVVGVDAIGPDRVTVERKGVGQPLRYTIDGQPYNGEIIHVPWYKMPGQLRGMNPIEVCRQSIGLGLAAQAYGGTFFGQSGIPSGVIEAPGSLTADQANVIRENWLRQHGGASRANRPAVLTQGASFRQITVAPEQAQFLETRRFTAAEIATNIYKVPPDMVGTAIDGSSITYQNLESRWSEFIKRACLPLMNRLERAFSRMVAEGEAVRFVPDVYLRADTKTRYEAYAIGITNGFLTIAEVRKFEDMLPDVAEEPSPGEVEDAPGDSAEDTAEDAMPGATS